jgi:hypothetical protein
VFSAIPPSGISYAGRLDHGSIDDERHTNKGGPAAVAVAVPHGRAGAIAGCRAHGVW